MTSPKAKSADPFEHPPLILEFSRMKKADLKKVVEIDAQPDQQPWSSRLFLDEISRIDTRDYTTVRCDGEIIAFSGVMYVEPEAHVTTIAVDESWQRRGVATALLIHIIDVAIERGAIEMGLEVRVGNVAAENLYRKFGFMPISIRKNYYPVTGDDATVMWLSDIDSHEYATRLNSIRTEVRHVEHEWRT